MKKRWTNHEIMTVVRLRDPRLSPDNQSVLYNAIVPVKTDKEYEYRARIYVSSTKAPEQPLLLTPEYLSGFNPRWSPDGKWISFLTASSGSLNLCLIKPTGGETFLLTRFSTNIQSYKWASDNKRIAFVMSEGNQSPSKIPFNYDTPLPHNRLWVIDIQSPQDVKPLSPLEWHVRGNGEFGAMLEDFDWSPDGKTIAVAYSPSPRREDYFLNSSIALLDTITGKASLWANHGQHESLPRYSPDGNSIGYLSSGKQSSFFCDRHFCVRSANGKNHKELAPTYNEGPFPDEPSLLGWTADGKHLIGFEPKHTRMEFSLIPVNGGKPHEIPSKTCSFRYPSLSFDGTHFTFIGQTQETPPEVYYCLVENSEPTKLTTINQQFVDEYPRIKTESITWKSLDGLAIEGLFTLPINYKKGKKCPLVVIIHGGPMRFFEESFIALPDHYPQAAFAQEGFAILKPNIRGSCGYGESFRKGVFKEWGGMDFGDLISGIDFLIKEGIVDPERIGLLGWSYGGYLAAWAGARTKRFKAVSMGAAITDLVSMAGTTDIPAFFRDYFGADIFGDLPLYLERSPLFYAQQVETPFLIQHGDQDFRVPIEQSIEFYHALKNQGKEVEFIVYPGAPHVFITAAEVYDSMERNLEWFKKYCL